MTERRARGKSPAGRNDRRPSSRSRSTSGAKRSESASTTKKSTATKSTTKRRTAAKAKPERHERKIVGLSTGRAVLLVAVMCGLVLTLAVPVRTYFTQRADAKELAAQHNQLQDEVADLRDRRAQQQDPNYIKAEARDRLRLVMPGDTPYIVQIPQIEQPAIPAPATKSKAPDPWYTQVWHSISSPQPAAAQATPPPIQEGQPR